MRILNICEHPIHGRCYLWQKHEMNYAVGTSATNFMKFDGFTLDEVIERITVKGFKIVPWAWVAQ